MRLIDAEPYAGCRIVANREDSGVSIDEIKTVDAVPVVHGKWKEEPFLLGTTHRCNLCGENYGMPHGIFNYCPNCGAKMDGAQEVDDAEEG